MKIDTDLRLAIRSALKTRKTDWQRKAANKAVAVAQLLKSKPVIQQKMVRMAKLKNQIGKLSKQIDEIETETGLRFEYGDVGKTVIGSEKTFIRVGGKLPITTGNPSFDEVMKTITEAPDQKALNAILKRLNIVWK